MVKQAEVFTHYKIDSVKFIKDDKGQEIYADCDPHEANEYILLGCYTGAHGIEICDAIFASGQMLDCTNLYARITGYKYE